MFMYLIITIILASISLLWSVVAQYADTHSHCYLTESKLHKEIEKLKHENLRYYARFGILQEDSGKD